MKFFYSAGASSLAVHLLLNELALDYEAEKVNLSQKTWSGGSYDAVNEKSYVPALVTDTGATLTEVAVILEYLARFAKNDTVLAPYGTTLYWQQRMWLNYIATELHKNFISPFRHGNWLPNTADSRALIEKRVTPRLAYIDQHVGEWKKNAADLTVVDCYLFVMTTWVKRLALNLADFPHLETFYHQMITRKVVSQTMQAEGKPHALVENNH